MSEHIWASLVAQLVKNPPAMQETLVQFPGREDPLEKGLGYPLQYCWASLVAQLERICQQCGRPGFDPWVGNIPWGRAWQPIPVFWPEELPWTEEPAGYSPWGHRVGHNWVSTAQHTFAGSWKVNEHLSCRIIAVGGFKLLMVTDFGPRSPSRWWSKGKVEMGTKSS